VLNYVKERGDVEFAFNLLLTPQILFSSCWLLVIVRVISGMPGVVELIIWELR